jgi:hypothetical protein
MSTKEEQIEKDVKVNKNNITKTIINRFVEEVDMANNNYKLNELINVLKSSYKSVKKKKDVVKKNPSAYNLFIKDAMTKLKEEEPELKNKELLTRAAKLWQEEKNKNK